MRQKNNNEGKTINERMAFSFGFVGVKELVISKVSYRHCLTAKTRP